MYTTRTPLALAIVLVAAASIAGCRGSGTAYNPPGGTSSLTDKHMYISNASSPGEISVYTLPITSSSTPTATVSVGEEPAMLFVDKAGRLFVGHFGTSTVEAFRLPLTSSSTPAFTLTSSEPAPDDVAEDASGNMYLADEDGDGYVDIYDGPVSGSRATPDTTISNNSVGTSGLAYPYGIAIAPNGDLYASDAHDINQFTPPFTSSTVPSASVTPNDNNYGLRVDSSGRIFVPDASANGVINVYASPLTNSSTPAFNLNITSVPIFGVAFDGSGNLWALDQDGNLWKVPAPITSSSTATEVLTGLTGYGIAFGP